MNEFRYYTDRARINEDHAIKYDKNGNLRVSSELKFYNDETGEMIWEPLHNRTVIAGSALMAMKLFELDRSCLNNTPTYDTELELDDAATASSYPSITVKDSNGFVVGSVPDESQRMIIGFCVGQGGAGLDISDTFDVDYASWIDPDSLVPFMYPLQSADAVDESIYKGKKNILLSNGQTRTAYYFKEFSNSPTMVQNYISTTGNFADTVTSANVYKNKTMANKAQTYVELHLKITKSDCRDFFIAHKGLANAKINQLSLVSGWRRTVEKTKLDSDGNTRTKSIEVFTDIRPFSLINIPTEILSDPEKSVCCVYTLYF
jgi:hypothetical protein